MKTYEPRKDSVQHIPVFNPMKVFFPHPHIKFGLIKGVVKGVVKTNSKDSNT